MNSPIMTLVLLLSITVFITFGANRFSDDMLSIATGLTWVGSLSVLLAFGTMIWVRPGVPQAFEKNTHDLEKGQAALITILKRVPELNSSTMLTNTSLRSLLDSESSHEFLLGAEKDRGLMAWQLISMGRRVSPEFAASLGFGLLAGLIAFILAAWNILTGGQTITRGIGMGNAFIAGASLLILFLRIAFVDTLGTIANIRIRLIAALAEMEVTWAPWWFIIGLFLVALAGVAFMLSGSSVTTDYDSDRDNWEGYYV